MPPVRCVAPGVGAPLAVRRLTVKGMPPGTVRLRLDAPYPECGSVEMKNENNKKEEERMPPRGSVAHSSG